MVVQLTVPRINPNDEKVQVVGILVAEGGAVRAGDELFELETDKSIVPLVAERDGYVLRILCTLGENLPVGAPLAWLGETPDAPIPQQEALPDNAVQEVSTEPTLKALMLLKRHSLTADQIPFSGPRLTAMDVESFMAANLGASSLSLPQAPGEWEEMAPHDRAMAQAVRWQSEQATATYLECAFDPVPWRRWASEFAREHKLMFDPLLGLLGHRLVQEVVRCPVFNATLVGDRRWAYHDINLGVTIQVENRLQLVVVHQAQQLPPLSLVRQLAGLQRNVLKGSLSWEESKGATVVFTSMARWNVSRHVPVLAPYTALIVSHATPTTGPLKGSGTLGATYDHRLINGGQVAELLQSLTEPPTGKESHD